MLASGPQTRYLHEPFNPVLTVRGFAHVPVEHWFQRVCPDNESPFLNPVRKLLANECCAVRDLATLPGRRRIRRTARQ